MAHDDLGTDQPRRHRVGVALEGNERGGTDLVVLDDGGRVGGGGKGSQPLELGQVADARSPTSARGEERGGAVFAHELFELGHRARALVGGALAEAVEARLGLGHGLCAHGAPEALRGVVDGLLHRPLAVAPPGRTGHDGHRVVLGHGDEAGLHDAALGLDDRRHAIDAPAPGGAAEAAQHLVEGLDQMGLVLGLGEDAAELARARERPHQQMGVVAPRSFWQFDPVPLDLFARRVLDLDGGPTLDARTRLAVGTELVGAQAPGEALVAEREPEGADLVIEGACPHVGVLGEAGSQIRDVLDEGVGFCASALAGHPLAIQVGPDRLAVPTQVPGDGRDRPALLA